MLTIDDIVKVSLTIGGQSTTASVFDVGLILGSSSVISTSDRVKGYDSLEAVVTAGFTTASDEYKAAALYFGQSPAPARLYIGVIGDNETPLDAFQACLAKTTAFDSVYVIEATLAQMSDLVAYFDRVGHYHLWYEVTDTVTAATAANGAFATLLATGSTRACGVYASSELDAVAIMGALLGKLHAHPEGAVQACYTTAVGITPTDLTQSQITDIKNAGGNVYISRRAGVGLFENGQTPSGLRIDDAIYLDEMISAMQNACYDLITDQATRLPQTDETSTMFLSAVCGVLDTYSARSIIAKGRWNGNPIGNVETGDMLEDGYAVYVDAYDNQPQADRLAHKAMPITVAIILGGSVESVEISLYVQQ